MENRKRYLSSGSSDEDLVSLKMLKSEVYTIHDSDSDSNTTLILPEKHEDGLRFSHNDLYKYSMEKCEFCDSIFHTRYDHFVHNADHLLISLARCPIHKCTKCHAHFLSLQQLHHHTVTKHIKNAPDLLASIVKNDRMNGISWLDERTSILENIFDNDKTPVVQRDGSPILVLKACRNKNSKNIKRDFSSFVGKTPVVTCTRVTEFITAGNDKIKIKNYNDIVKKDGVVKRDKKIAKNDNIDNDIEETPVTRCDDSITELTKASNDKISGLKSTSNEEESYKCEEDIDLFKTNVNNFTSRFIFEDDSGDDDLFNNTNDGANLNGLGSFNNGFNKKGEDIENNKIVAQPIRGKIVLGSRAENSTDVIPYEDLQKPGLYFCKRCRMSFPNRYETYIHEKVHIQIKQRHPPVCHHCDSYIAGNYKTLNQHIERKHGDAVKKKPCPNACSKCGLKYYNYKSHSLLYHYNYKCSKCGMKFQDESGKVEHEERSTAAGGCQNLKVANDGWKYIETSTERVKPDGLSEDWNEFKMIKMCEVCFLFLKNSNKMKYVPCGEFSKVGEKQQCKRCLKKLFEVKLVKAFRKRGEVKYVKKSMDHKSNEDRLKNIQHRLKMFNKLTRF